MGGKNRVSTHVRLSYEEHTHSKKACHMRTSLQTLRPPKNA